MLVKANEKAPPSDPTGSGVFTESPIALHLRTAFSKTPSVLQRCVFASLIAALAAAVAYSHYSSAGQFHSDFGMVWFGARSLLRGIDPYGLVGPGREFDYEWHLIYPGTALVAVAPLTIFSERVATSLFVAFSTWLLAFGITRDGWYRIPIFVSGAFVASAQLGQWSILFTAGLFFPWIALLAAAKPTASIPILAATLRSRTLFFAMGGAIVLAAISFLLLPSWPRSWLAEIRMTSNMEPPIVRLGGPLLLLTLLRWRRPESWLLVALAMMPQSWGWYNTLPIFAIPRTFGESVFLAGSALVGAAFAGLALNPGNVDALFSSVGAIIVWTIYLPAAFLILRRQNEGDPPAWLRLVASGFWKLKQPRGP